MNIWILDDDEAMCALLSRQCQKLNWHMQALHHPRQLPKALQEGRPDVLLLDQLLPEKHGLDVLASLQQAGRAFPVLILSALGAPSDRIAGLEAGADDYLSKPFHFRELQLRVERLLRHPYAGPISERSPCPLAPSNWPICGLRRAVSRACSLPGETCIASAGESVPCCTPFAAVRATP